MSQRPELTGTVTICGKIQHPETVAARLYLQNPDFKKLLAQVSVSIEQIKKSKRIQRVLSLYSPHDTVVPVEDTFVPGAAHVKIPARNHATGIASGIILGPFWFAGFLHKLAKRS